MKHFLLCLLVLFVTNIAKANWYVINANGKVIPFGQIAKVGRVSVFILTVPSCGACKILENRLKNFDNEFDEDIDFYKVNLANNSEEERVFAKSPAFGIWQNVEKLRTFPYIYILNQATHTVARGDFKFEDIKAKTTEMIQLFKSFNSETMMYKPKELIAIAEIKKDDKHAVNKKDLEQENSNLNNKSETIDNENLPKIGIDIGLHDNPPYSHLRVKIIGASLENVDIIETQDGVIFRLKDGVFKSEDLVKAKFRGAALFEITTPKECKELFIAQKRFCKIIELKKNISGGYCDIKYTN